MMRKLRRFWSLAKLERWLTIEALVLPIGIGASFRLIGVPRTQAWVSRRARTKGREPADSEEIIRMAKRAQARVRRTTGIAGPCLVRSLTLWALLSRRGIATDLRVGFRRRDGRIEGHAWVEHASIPLNETASEVGTYSISDQPVRFDRWLRQ